MKIHILGQPGAVGGASTELWHTLLLWRRYGCEIAITPTWRADPVQAARCESIGCTIQEASPRTLRPAPEAIVLSLCNAEFFAGLRRLDQKRNPGIWIPCMNWLTDREIRRYEQGLIPAAIVCQSYYQRSVIGPVLRKHGIVQDRIVRIRGAFDASTYPYTPKARGEKFVVGRISRADSKKFRPDLWHVLDRVRKQIDRPLRARVLGWRKRLEKLCGPVPEWADVHDPGTLDALEFMRSLDVLYQSGECAENWPRVGLEAMANGTPIVTDNQGGWVEMADGGRLAALVSNADEAAESMVALARYGDKELMQLTSGVRHAMESQLASTDELWQQWQSLFARVSDGEWTR